MIDWSRLEELRGEIGQDGFAEVLDLFLTEVESALEAVDTCADRTRLSEHFHFLKGSALNIGLTELADLCARAEADPCSVPAAAVRNAYVMSRDQLRAALQDRLAS